MTATVPAVPPVPVGLALEPAQIRGIQTRAERVHPDEPVASAREVLALIGALRDADARSVPAVVQAARARDLAREWIHHPDITVAAAGRILARTLDTPHNRAHHSGVYGGARSEGGRS